MPIDGRSDGAGDPGGSLSGVVKGPSGEKHPHASAEKHPHASAEKHPHASGEKHPHASADKRPHASAEKRRPASGEKRPHASAEEIAREAALYRRLQRAVDISVALIYQTSDLTIGDAIEIVLEVRGIALSLFPGSEETFDLLYRPRLMRVIRERFGIDDLSA